MNIVKFTGTNQFVVRQLQSLFDQHQFELSNLNTIFFKYEVYEKNDSLFIRGGGNIFNYSCPTNFKSIFSDIYNHLNTIKFKIDKINYHPFNSHLELENKNIKINYIHNMILVFLIFNSEGFQKESLYKKIWPKDFNISINKLDTHLTNLKEIFRSNFNYEINLKSHKGLIKLIVN